MNNRWLFSALRMNKKTLLIMVIILFLAILLCVTLLNNRGLIAKKGRIKTDIPVSQDPKDQCMVVPAIAIFQELGYSTTQQSEDVILLEKGKQQFVLNLEELSLIDSEDTSGFNYFTQPPGGIYYCWCSRNGNEIMIDPVTFNSALFLMGSDYRISEDPECKVVVIYRK